MKNPLKLTAERKVQLENFCKSIGIYLKDLNILNLAFHHKSFSNEKNLPKIISNERLEFLGDSVLGLVTTSYLYDELENHTEGELSKIKECVVSEQSLAPVALKLGLDKFLILSKGEEHTGGRQKKAILADCVEAVIAAIYLDSGFKTAEKFVLSFIKDEVKKTIENKGIINYKQILSESLLKKYKKNPVYETIKETGPDHDKTFFISVVFDGKKFKAGEGKNKKEAEQIAAKNALEELFPEKL